MLHSDYATLPQTAFLGLKVWLSVVDADNLVYTSNKARSDSVAPIEKVVNFPSISGADHIYNFMGIEKFNQIQLPCLKFRKTFFGGLIY